MMVFKPVDRSSSLSRHPLSAGLTSVRVVGLVALVFITGGMTGGTCAPTPTPPATAPITTNDSNLAFRRPAILPEDHVLGNAAATLVIVQYEDYQAAACGRFARDNFAAFKQNYIDSGKVRWVFRQFPQNADPRALPAAKAAECANDQGAFFDYRDLVYATVDSSNATILTDAQLKAHAATLGLDTTTFNACFTGDSKDARVQQDVDTATALGLTTVPTFVVGTEVVANPTTPDKLSTIIERHLNAQ